ncbi:MAG: hypothetical protein GY943_26155 [Chloroflexi bacterium]|nr:hypothetical protein [Chloroflexota bacterium]
MQQPNDKRRRRLLNSPLVSGALRPLGEKAPPIRPAAQPEPKPPEATDPPPVTAMTEDAKDEDPVVDEIELVDLVEDDTDRKSIFEVFHEEQTAVLDDEKTADTEIEPAKVVEDDEEPESVFEELSQTETAVLDDEDHDEMSSIFFTPSIESPPTEETHDTGLWNAVVMPAGGEAPIETMPFPPPVATPEPEQKSSETIVINPTAVEIIPVSQQRVILTKRPCFQAFLTYEVTGVTAVAFWAASILIWVTVDGIPGWLTAVLILACLASLAAVITAMAAFVKCKREAAS